MWSQSEDGSTTIPPLSVCLSTRVTAEFNTKLTVKFRYLVCRVLTAPPPHSLLHPLSSVWVDNNRAIALGFGEQRFWLAAAQTGRVWATWKQAPQRGSRWGVCVCRGANLGDGGTGALRASHTVRHAHSWAYFVTDKWAEEGAVSVLYTSCWQAGRAGKFAFSKWSGVWSGWGEVVHLPLTFAKVFFSTLVARLNFNYER